MPRDAPTPVVANDVGALHAGLVEQGDDVAAQLVERVRPALFGTGAAGVAPLVRCKHPVAGVDEQRRDFVPRRRADSGKPCSNTMTSPVDGPASVTSNV